MKAIVLAAGKGTRLRPFTDDKPKCLVEISGKSILQHQINVFRLCGISDIQVIGGYLADKINIENIKLHLNQDFDTTNMVFTLFCASEEFDGSSDIIISYGDIVYEKSVLEKLIAAKDPLNLVIDEEWFRYWSARMENPFDDAETLKLNNEGLITELGKKPQSIDDIEGQYTGLIKIRTDYTRKLLKVWRELDKSQIYDGQTYQNMYMTSFLQHLIDIGWAVRAIPTKNCWAEIDTVSDLLAAPDFWTPEN